ncbi:MAG: TonB-dependent receptor, partial [Gammaproteobacteria bacterium]|nr:TonB-dependent receptor [Gammaproteobacteria bacterium]
MQRTNLFWIALGLLLSTASFSQVAVAEAEATIEEVVVTGSRIARDTFTSTAPLTVLDAGEISAVGATNVGEFLSRIPQSIAASNSSNNVFASTASGLQLTSLRNLGSQRTLTLVNGKRFVSGITPSSGYAVDMNAIPAALIERIEIKTGATSAIYGSDAVAGVVNLIMKEDFEGIEIKVQSNQPEQGNRERYDIDIAMGSNFDNGNAWIAFGYSDDKGISASERDFSDTDLAYYTRGALDALGFPNRAPGDYWLGSSFPPGGRFGGFQGDGTPFRSGLADRPNSDRFNRANFRDLASPTERKYAAAGMTYSISDQLEAKVMVNYNQTEIQTTFEPFPLDLVSDIWDIPKGGTGGLDIATSPLLPALLRTNLLAAGLTNLNELAANTSSRRLVEFQGRGSGIDRRTFAIQSDLTYSFDNGTALELFASWGQTTANQQNNSGINAERTALALDVEVFDGAMRCVSEEARRFGCVPFNPFGVNTISAGAVEYVGLNTQTDQRVEQLVFGATLVGDMHFAPELPGGAIGYAVGFERRVEKGSETPDAAVQSGVTTSNKLAATAGRFDVDEFFGEVSLPVFDNFTVDAAYRVGDYSTVGKQSNWSVGLDWRVAEWARLRGTFSNAV